MYTSILVVFEILQDTHEIFWTHTQLSWSTVAITFILLSSGRAKKKIPYYIIKKGKKVTKEVIMIFEHFKLIFCV